MLEKYRAIIHGNKIEWEGDAPKALAKNATIEVDVTVVSKNPVLKKPDGKKMAAALEKIAASGGVDSIGDPLKWQRNIRKDRALPERK